MKKPFIHALAAAAYIVLIVFVTNIIGSALKSQNDSIIIPITMLSLFVLSAAIMGFIFLYEPLRMLVEGNKQGALAFFGKEVGFFAGFVLLFTILLFTFPNLFGSIRESSNESSDSGNLKINIDVVCEGALAYMTFPNGAAAEAFVEECKAGEHPEVIEQYKAQTNLGDGAAI
jgi:hypothetical protein